MTAAEVRMMFEEEERLLAESHRKTIDRDKKIMQMIEHARRSTKRKRCES